MNQQYPYPDGPGHDPQSPHQEPPSQTSYDFDPVQQPGYDPTSSLPVMGGQQPQQPGYGPPPPAGGMPPQPMGAEPKKSNTPLILGLVIGLVALIGIAGVGVWFLFLKGPSGGGPGGAANADSADGKPDPFPKTYTVTETEPPKDQTWGLTKPDSYDKCVDLNLEPVKSVIPFDGNPKGETKAEEDGTGYVNCSGSMVGHHTEDRKSRATGTFYVDFVAYKDIETATAEYDKIWDSGIASNYKEAEQLGFGAASESRTKLSNNVRNVAIAYRFGNVLGVANIGINFSDIYVEPDRQMLTNVLTDVIYSGLNGN